MYKLVTLQSIKKAIDMAALTTGLEYVRASLKECYEVIKCEV